MEVSRVIRKSSCICLFIVTLFLAHEALPATAFASPQHLCGEWESVAELQGRRVHDILVQATTVFVATDEGVFSSEDGLTWRLTQLRLPTYSLAYSKAGLLAGTEDGVYVSADGGVTWRELGLKRKRVTALAVSGNVMYAGTDEGVYRRERGGDWRATSLNEPIKSLAADPVNPNLVYAGTRGGVLTGWGDLYISANGGETWSRAWLSNITSLALIALLPVLGTPLYYEVASIAVNPCNPQGVYVGTRAIFTVFLVVPMTAGALHASFDGGRSWSYLGPPLKCVFDILIGSNCRTFVLGTNDGIFISEDSGQSWYHLGLANETVWAVECRGAEIYAGTSSGLLVFHRKIYPTKLSLTVEPSWIPSTAVAPSVSLSGNLTSLGEGVPGKTLKVLFNGSETSLCRTNTRGSYNCTVTWQAARAKTVNVTVLYPGDPCHEPCRAIILFHSINVTTAYGRVEGAGWYSEGSTATVYVTRTVVSEGINEYVFKGWRVRGTIASTEPVLTLVVKEPMEIEAVWEQRLSATALTVIAAIAVVVAASLLLIVILVAKERRAL